MALTFLENERTLNFKCTIQKSGRLGFTDKSAKILSLKRNDLVSFARDENKNLCLVLKANGDPKYSFRVYQAGIYFSIPAAELFTALGFHFKEKTIIFDLSSHPKYPNTYIMSPRYFERRKTLKG